MIGGFQELELVSRKSYHIHALALNTGRNCLVYLLKAKKIKTLHLPHYICDSVITTAEENGIEINFYTLNEDFTPNLDNYAGDSSEYFLYVNYFGLCEKIITFLIGKEINLIVDNNHSFFAHPHQNIDTFYSPRKFFGVPDGGYLYSTSSHELALEKDESFTRFTHLLSRIDKGFEEGYHHYEENEKILDRVPLKRMSRITERLLESIDYEDAKKKRSENMQLYQQRIGDKNLLPLPITPGIAPHTYPFMTRNTDQLRDKLFTKGVYPFQYWKKVLARVAANSFEYTLSENIIGLPIDQRYSKEDIEYVINILSEE